MRRQQTAIRWCAASLMVLFVASNGVAEKLTCPKHCFCAPEGHGEYEISCPDVGEQRIAVQLKPDNKSFLSCQVNTNQENYKLLSDLYFDAVTSLEFRLCPLPDSGPFTDILKIRHPAQVHTFTFQSYRSFNNTLRRDLFKRLTGIINLTLAQNGLTSLPSDIFMDMPHLRNLYLNNNQLELPADLFQPVLGLETLELGKNELSHLPPDLFRNLKKLQLLNLWKNKLTNLTSEVFRDLTSLTSLDLRHNGLKSLPADIFKHLTSLKSLNLNGNNFGILPIGLFSTNKALTDAQISDGRGSSLELPNGLFSNLPNLTSIDLHNNALKKIPEDVFWGSHGIVSIALQNNLLKELPSGLFRDADQVETLSLASNHIHSLDQQVFKACKKLKSLNLSFNRLTDITMDLFSSSELLEELYLQNNLLKVIYPARSTKCKVKRLNLANNKLTMFDEEGSRRHEPLGDLGDFGEVSPLANCKELEKIDLFNNSISSVFFDWRYDKPHLISVNLSHNAFEVLDFVQAAFGTSPEIDLRNNKISVINLAAAEDWAILNKNGKTQRWLLEGNPVSCNCSNYDFLRYIGNNVAPELRSTVEFVTGNLACASPDEWANQPIPQNMYKAIVCPIDNAVDCSYPCSCGFRNADNAIIVDCIGKNMTEAPARLPTRPDSNHTELYLTDNKLQALPDFSLSGYEFVSKLAIGHNNLSNLSNITILPLHLQALELDNNNLSSIDHATIKKFSNLTGLKNITLHGNPWTCDCQLQYLVTFIQQHYEQVHSLKYINCSDGQLLSDPKALGLCTQTSSIVWGSLVAALFVGGLIGGAFAVYYKYNYEIKIWMYAHNLFLWFITEEDLDKDKQYDAFVSYSHKDEKFVVKELVSVLEGGSNPFKLCLHYRDWVGGEFIQNQIARSVENSRRTLVVLSKNFLDSEWGKMEFRDAHCLALKEGRIRVILVLLEDIPTDKLDPELRAYINSYTYIKWGDPGFWNKLLYSLPHSTKKGRVDLVNRNVKHANGKCLDDKIELITEPNSAPVTTPPAEGNETDLLSIRIDFNGSASSPRKVPNSSHELNGTRAAIC